LSCKTSEDEPNAILHTYNVSLELKNRQEV